MQVARKAARPSWQGGGGGAGGPPPRPPPRDRLAGGGAAVRLLDRVHAPPELTELAERLLGRVWVVDSLADVPRDFDGLAVTRAGRRRDGATGELAPAPAGGGEGV